MADADRAVADLARGGDILAAILGYVLLRAETGEIDDYPETLSAAWEAVLLWHQLKADRLR